MKTILFLVIPCTIWAQTVVNGGRIFKGTLDASSATRTLPHRTGTGSPAGRDNCVAEGETYFELEGANLWACTLAGTPGTWTMLNAAGGGGLPDPGSGGIVARTAPGVTTARTISAGTGFAIANGDGVYGNPVLSLNTAVALTNANAQANKTNYCVLTSSGVLAFACSLSATATLTAYSTGMCLDIPPDTTSDGSTQPTVNVDGVGPKNITQADGTTIPASGQITAGRQFRACYDGTVFRMPPFIPTCLNVQTGTSYSLQANDNGCTVTLNNASAITLTVPAGLATGFNVLIVQLGAGPVTPAASGTTLVQRQSFTKTAGQYAVMTLVSYAANTFVMAGDMQ
jgi:hypothetical protein